MKTLEYKVKYNLKNSVKRFPIMMKLLLAVLGVFLTIAECVHFMFESKIVYELIHTYALYILCFCVIGCFYMARTRTQYEYFIRGTDVKITLKVCDIFRSDNAIVIPTNTTFDTKMKDDFISINSIQGQFQNEYFKNNVDELNELLDKGLEGFAYKELDRLNSKNKQYPLGTVSKITVANQHFYFVAIADINEYGKPINTRFENIQIALEGIWRCLENRGHIENIAIPLIGTGKAGIKEATREKVIKEIIFSFIASHKERKVTERLLICVHPSDLNYKELDFEEMNEYLQYMC